MNNIKLVSKDGDNFFFSQDNLCFIENGSFYKLNLQSNKKVPICYGGILLETYNGAKLYFKNKTFYLKE